MKAVFVDQQLEIKMEIKGDDFSQGDTIPCLLSVKNHASSGQSLENLVLQIACGDVKKVKQKTDEAFEVISEAALAPLGEIQSQQQVSFSWSFELDKNCAVSEKSQSLYVRFGLKNLLHELPLSIKTHDYLQEIYRLLETYFQFVLKGEKSADGCLCAKFKPPAGQRFPMVNELYLYSKFEDGILNLRYHFKVKKLDASSSSVGVKKGEAEIEQQLDVDKCFVSKGYVDQVFLETTIGEALANVESKW